KTFCKHLAEVVAQLRFDLEVAICIDPQSPTNPGEVRVIRLIQAEVVREYANLPVLLCRRSGHDCYRSEQDANHPNEPLHGLSLALSLHFWSARCFHQGGMSGSTLSRTPA